MLFMRPLKPQQPCVRRGAWCFINAACHWISTTLRGQDSYPVNQTLGLCDSQPRSVFPALQSLPVGTSTIASKGLVRNHSDMVWCEAFVTWKAWSKYRLQLWLLKN